MKEKKRIKDLFEKDSRFNLGSSCSQWFTWTAPASTLSEGDASLRQTHKCEAKFVAWLVLMHFFFGLGGKRSCSLAISGLDFASKLERLNILNIVYHSGNIFRIWVIYRATYDKTSTAYSLIVYAAMYHRSCGICQVGGQEDPYAVHLLYQVFSYRELTVDTFDNE